MVPATSGQRYHVALRLWRAVTWRSTEFHMFLVALSGSAAGATRNMRADCAAWVMLHTYKSGGTTLRSLAHSWADRNFTSNYWTSTSNGAFSNMHPDTTPFSVRLSKLSAPDEPATLLERTGAHLAAHPGRACEPLSSSTARLRRTSTLGCGAAPSSARACAAAYSRPTCAHTPRTTSQYCRPAATPRLQVCSSERPRG